jgi:hypothetical protein
MTPGSQWSRFADKVLPPLFVSLVLVVAGGLYATYQKVVLLGIKTEAQDRVIAQQNATIDLLRSESVTKKEFLAAIEAMGQRFEIALLRAGLPPGNVRVGKE